MRLYTSELVKKYKARTVVDHVSIDVNQGEIVGLLGPNGAGKTTTFYMIVGLIKPNEGRIFLESDEGQTTELTDYPVYRRAQLGVGYLAQEASVFRRLSVEDNIRAVLEMTTFSKEYQAERVEALIEVKIAPRSGSGFDGVAEEIAAHEEVKTLYLMSGAYDLLVIVEASSIKSVSRFVSECISTFDCVLSTATHFILKKYKEKGIFIDDEEPDERGLC